MSKCINPVRKGRVNSTIRQWTEGLDGRAPEGGPCENSREAREDTPDATGQQDEATGSALTGRFAPRAWRVRAPADPCIGEDTGGRSPPGFSRPRSPEPLGLQSGRGVSSLDPPASPATSAAWGLRGGVGLRAPVPAFPTRGSSSRGLRAMGTLDGSSCSVGCQRGRPGTQDAPPLGPRRTAPVSTQGQHWRDPRPTLRRGRASKGRAGCRAGSRRPRSRERLSRASALRTVSLSAHVRKRVRVLHAAARPPRAPSAQPRPCSMRPSCSWRPVGRTCPQRGGSSPQKACELIAQHSRY